MAGEVTERQMEVAGEIVLEVLRMEKWSKKVWKAETPEELAKEIATVYRIIYNAIGETMVGQGGGASKGER